VHRALGQQRQDRGANVATPTTAAAAAMMPPATRTAETSRTKSAAEAAPSTGRNRWERRSKIAAAHAMRPIVGLVSEFHI